MTSQTLQDLMQSFASRSAVRFLIRQAAAELETIDPATGRVHRWRVGLRPTADGAFDVQVNDASMLAFIRRGLAFGLTSEAPAASPATRLLDESGVPTEDAVQRVQSWVEVSAGEPGAHTEADAATRPTGVRLTLRDARVEWRPALAV